jgi:hypothetical protein
MWLQSSICGGAVWVATGSYMTESDVSHVTRSRVTGRGPVQKYVMRMRKRRNIRPSEVF